MSKYYTVQETTREKFYRLPKVFFTNEKYQKLPNDVKMAYAILQDRLQLSIKNKWIDDETGRIYFIYSNAKLQDILNVSKNHVTKVKKLLVEAELLDIKKRYHNQTDILFLLKPEVTENDIYQIEQEENDVEASDDAESHTVGTRNPIQWEPGIPYSGNPESHTVGANDTEYLSDTDYNNTEYSENDMIDMFDNDINSHSNKKSNQSNQTHHSLSSEVEVTNEDHKHMMLHNYPKVIENELQVFSISDITLILNVLLKAKKNAENNWGKNFIDYRFETHENEIAKIIRALKIKAKQNQESIESLQGYLMKMLQNYYTKTVTEKMYEDGLTDNVDYTHNY